MKKLLALAVLLAPTAHAQGARGVIFVAFDGTFLGTCEGTAGTYSIGNSFSPYGSEFGLNSMYNKFSMYGSNFSIYSPYGSNLSYAPYAVGYTPALYNLFTDRSYQPTQAIRDSLSRAGLMRVSINPFGDTIDPDALRALCRNP